MIAGSLASPKVPRAMPAGLAGIAAGCALLALGGPAAPAAPRSWSWAPGSAGQRRVDQSRRRRRAQGVASGVLNTAAQLGTAIGLAVIVAPAAALGFRWGWAGCAAIALSSSVATPRAAGSSPTCGSASGSAYTPKHTRRAA